MNAHLAFVLWFFAAPFSTPVRGNAEIVYFPVTEKNSYHDDSCILPLTKAEHIAEAWRQIKEVPFKERRFPATRIALGGDGINRNYSAPGAPPWSWRIIEFLGFYEAAAGTVQAYPKGIEQGQRKDGDVAAFLSYAIQLDLSPPPLTLAVAQPVDSLEFTWPNLGTNYVYTVEVSESVQAADWKPVQSQAWPTERTTWLLEASASSSRRFFRVRAQLRN